MIVVVGTHRSGSSYVTQLLHGAGVSLGPASGFLPADQWNPRGYFEQTEIINLNSRILTGFRRTHSRVEALCCQTRYALLPGVDGVARPAATQPRSRRQADDSRDVSSRIRASASRIPLDEDFAHCRRGGGDAPPGGQCAVHEPPRSHFAAPGLSFLGLPCDTPARVVDPSRALFVDYDELAGPHAAPHLARLHRYFGLRVPLGDFSAHAHSLFSADLRHWSADSTGDLPPSTRALWSRLRAAADASAPTRPGTTG